MNKGLKTAETPVTMFFWRIIGQMQSEEHCFPAFFEVVDKVALSKATPEDIKKMIAQGYNVPIEKIEMVQGNQAKKIQRYFH